MATRSESEAAPRGAASSSASAAGDDSGADGTSTLRCDGHVPSSQGSAPNRPPRRPRTTGSAASRRYRLTPSVTRQPTPRTPTANALSATARRGAVGAARVGAARVGVARLAFRANAAAPRGAVRWRRRVRAKRRHEAPLRRPRAPRASADGTSTLRCDGYVPSSQGSAPNRPPRRRRTAGGAARRRSRLTPSVTRQPAPRAPTANALSATTPRTAHPHHPRGGRAGGVRSAHHAPPSPPPRRGGEAQTAAESTRSMRRSALPPR